MYNSILLNQLNEKQPPWMQIYRKQRLKQFEELEIPSWKRLGLKEVSLPEFQAFNHENINDNTEEQLVISSILDIATDEFKTYLETNEQYGIGEKYTTLTEAFYNTGIAIYVPKNKRIKKPIRIPYEMNRTQPILLDHNIIVVEENAEVTVVIEYKDGKSNCFHNGVTKVYAKTGSKVNVVKIQTLEDTAYHFDSNLGIVGQEAEINWMVIDLGSGINASDYTTYLQEEGSRATLKSIYLGDGTRKMDMGYSMIHRGRRSTSNIEAKGVLKDHAKKIFRGNLDFKKGAVRSKGVEEEYVILLDPTVKSDAIPALLCEEDDVEGEHAASAGQVDEDQLFYLMSRGFDEKQAKKLIVEASFRPILDQLPMEELRMTIEEEIHRRMVYGA